MVARLVGRSCRTGADILSHDLDDWPAEAVKVIVVIFVQTVGRAR